MLAILTKNKRFIQGTGVSFAMLGTTMHILNVASIMPSSVGHTWSTIAIAGFFLTSSSQIGKGLLFQLKFVKTATKTKGHWKSQPSHTDGRKNDVALP